MRTTFLHRSPPISQCKAMYTTPCTNKPGRQTLSPRLYQLFGIDSCLRHQLVLVTFDDGVDHYIGIGSSNVTNVE
eukprot:m.89868 g.89868  ORF g.89868 m.89868 type:complete len:75 (-) comp26336_c0_seq1:388-612(-)